MKISTRMLQPMLFNRISAASSLAKVGLPRFGCELGWTGRIHSISSKQCCHRIASGVNKFESFDLLYFTEGMVAGLSYHIVPGVYLAEDLQDGAFLSTVEGQSVSISIGDSGPMVNDANIIHTDIEAFNGVIHVIDEVLVPAGYPGATTWDVIVQSPEHTILEQALLAENLDQALRGQPILNDNEPAEGPFTVFAPTDDDLRHGRGQRI